MFHAAKLVLMSHCLSTIGCWAASDTLPSDESGPATDSISVYVDPAVELISTIYRLAGFHQYDNQVLSSHLEDIEEYFGPFRNHRAVEMVRELERTHRINGSAPMALAVYLTSPGFQGKVPFSPLPPDLDPRWTEESVAAFLTAAREFSADTRFLGFFDTHKEYYERSVGNLRRSLEGHDIVPWLRNFYGQDTEHYAIIVGMQTGYGNYGLSTTLEDGSREFFSIIGAGFPSWFRHIPRFPERILIPTVVHEFAHSFVNPVVDANEEVLRDVAERLQPFNREVHLSQGYPTWQHLSFEYLVRASVIRYLHHQGDEGGVRRRIEVDEEQGFPGVTLLAEALAEYEADRETYPTLEDFMPRVAACFEAILRTL